LLAGLPQREGVPWAFTTARGSTPICNFSRAKDALDRALGEQVAEWNTHDLRRSCATGMAKLGVAPHVISAVLNHAAVGVTQRHYARSIATMRRSAPRSTCGPRILRAWWRGK
jgi:integrase